MCVWVALGRRSRTTLIFCFQLWGSFFCASERERLASALALALGRSDGWVAGKLWALLFC